MFKTAEFAADNVIGLECIGKLTEEDLRVRGHNGTKSCVHAT